MWLSRLCSALNMEAPMTGILDKLHVEHGIHGARIVARSPQLTGNCMSDSEIETAIEMLQADLDACSRVMKRLIKINRTGSLFEGWDLPDRMPQRLLWVDSGHQSCAAS